MGTTMQDIERWLERAKEMEATHLIVVSDSFDHSEYPIYVDKYQNINERIAYYQGASMQRIMEVYNMSMDIAAQLQETRVWNV